ncbi:MAG: YhjD/YihY/BrkB family envelope integrity protein [Myxococcaceae bacterium]
MATGANDSFLTRVERRVTQALEPLEGTKAGRFAFDTYWATRGLILGFRGHSISLRAGNLSFITITSLLPLLTVVLALLHALNQKGFEHAVVGFAQDVLTPGDRMKTDTYVQQFFTSASSRTAGGLSFLVLLVSAGLLLRHLDASLNEVWAVQRRRPLFISVGLYTGMLLFGPTLLGLTLVTTSGVRRLLLGSSVPFAPELVALGGVVAAVMVLTVLYKLAPHAPVRFRSALAGGLVAGIGWELARTLYGTTARMFFMANPIYGSLGIAPLFLMWLYICWLLVLFGARLSYAVEHATFRGVFHDLLSSPRSKELIAARLAQITATAFMKGEWAPTAREIGERFNIPAQLVEEIIRELETAQLIVVSRKGELRPAKNPHLLTLADVSAAVGGVGMLVKREGKPPRDVHFREFEKLFAEGDDASVEKLNQISWASLAELGPKS